MKVRLLAAILLIAFSCVASAGAAKPKLNVVVISLDTLRADRLGCYGCRRNNSPFIDQLAAEGVLFERAYSHATYTLPSHATLFTSLLPWTHQIFDIARTIPLSRFPTTLAETYQKEGYATAAFTDGYMMDGDYGFCRGFDVYVESRPFVAAKDWIKENYEKPEKPNDKPFFLFFHTYVVSRMGSIKLYARYDCRIDEKFQNLIYDLYDLPIPIGDGTVNALFKVLRDLNLYDSTMIVLTSDHGDSLCEEHNDGKFMSYAHGLAPYQPQIHVPLIIRVPERFRRGAKFVGRVADPVGQIDVAPTLLDISGISIPKQFRGRSLVAGMRGKSLKERPHFSIGLVSDNDWRNSAVAVLYKNKKYIHYTKTPEQDEFYDVARDPMEYNNLLNFRKNEADEYREMIQKKMEDGGWNQEVHKGDVKSDIDYDLIHALKSLGYLK